MSKYLWMGAAAEFAMNELIMCWWFVPQFGCALRTDYLNLAVLFSAVLMAFIFPRTRRPAAVFFLGAVLAFSFSKTWWRAWDLVQSRYPGYMVQPISAEKIPKFFESDASGNVKLSTPITAVTPGPMVLCMPGDKRPIDYELVLGPDWSANRGMTGAEHCWTLDLLSKPASPKTNTNGSRHYCVPGENENILELPKERPGSYWQRDDTVPIPGSTCYVEIKLPRDVGVRP